MNNEDIIRMAREARLVPEWLELCPKDEKALARFAALVAAAEREACAQVCEARFMGDMTREDMEARRCAAAIRARGNT